MRLALSETNSVPSTAVTDQQGRAADEAREQQQQQKKEKGDNLSSRNLSCNPAEGHINIAAPIAIQLDDDDMMLP
jgi:hypothetical protein